METTNKKVDLYWFNCIVGIFFMFGFGHLPPIDPITQVGMQVLGIFIGMIWLWSTVETLWPSILGIVALGMSDYCSMANAISSSIGNTTAWQLLTVFLIAGAVTESGCGEIIARWMISRKLVAGRPLLFCLIWFLTFFFLAIFLGATGMTILGWAILYSLVESLGYKKGDKTVTLLLMGTFLCGFFGTTCLPFKGVRIALCAAFASAAGMEVNYVPYMIVTISTGIIFTIIFTLSMKFVFKADLSKLANVDLEELKKDVRPLTFQEKAYIGAFFGCIVSMFAVTILPKEWPIIATLNKVTTNSIFAVFVVILCVMRKDGKPVLDFVKVASKRVQWNIFFVVACAIPVATALTNEVTGVSLFVSEFFSPVFGGKTPFMFVVIVILVALFLTNIGNNVAMGTLLIPIVVPFISTLGLIGGALGILLVYTVQFGIMTPGASGPIALIFGNDWLSIKDIYKYLTYTLLWTIILLICYAYPLSVLLN